MEALFLKVLSMSATAAVVILLVLLARLPLRRAPKVFSYALWAVVLFRLLCPFAIPSPWSFTPSIQVEPAGEEWSVVSVSTDRMEVVIRVDDAPVGRPESIPSDVPAGPPDSQGAPAQAAAPGFSAWAAAGIVWLAGAAALLGYGLISLLLLRRRLVGSVPLEGEKDVRLADHIPSPFVLGLIWPNIYLPSDLPEGERDYVLLHERTHIRRGDHIFRALAWLALAVHWFNPLVWLAFHLAGKDMEMSCDEAVLGQMGRDVRADYSSSLLRLSAGKRLPAGPLAFGAGDPTSRIKNVLSYKKPALWVIIIALVGVLCVGVALATNRSVSAEGNSPEPSPVAYREPGPAELWMDWRDDGHSMATADEIQLPEFPGVTFRITGDTVWAVTESGEKRLIEGTILKNVYFCDLDGDGCRELCATVMTVTSKGADDSVCVYNYKYHSSCVLEPKGKPFQYHLYLEGLQLWVREWDYEERVVLRTGPLVMTESGLDIRQKASPAELAVNLTLSMDEDGTNVRINGAVGGIAQKHSLWFSPAWFEQYGEEISYPLGQLIFEAPLCDNEVVCTLDACWTDESRSAVRVTATPRAMISSYAPAGNLSFTVATWEGGGALLEMNGYVPKLSHSAPELIPTEEEAITAARVAAKLLTAAEDWYLRQTAPANGSSEDMPGVSQPERVWSWGSSEDTPDKVNWNMEEWARDNGIHYQFSQQDIDSAIEAARAMLEEEWAEEEWVVSFEVTDVYEARTETLHNWFVYFDRMSTFFTDWTREDMETRYIVIGADYRCEYDHALTFLNDGQQQVAIALTRPAGGEWSVAFTGPYQYGNQGGAGD